MCLFSKAVSHVGDTKILVTLLGGQNKGKQLTVYQNSVQLKDGQKSAMILPFPNPGGASGTIKMIDTTSFPTLFQDLKSLFPAEPAAMKGFRGGFVAQNSSAPKLEIKTCGSYEYSIASSFEELPLIEWEHFEADKEVQKLLEANYAKDFGFLICKVHETGSHDAIGVIHPQIPNMLYVPTMHDHGDHGVPLWSHEIYAINTATMPSSHLLTSLDQVVATKHDHIKKPALLWSLLSNTLHKDIPSIGTISRFIVQGEQGNGDILLVESTSLAEFAKHECTYGLTGSKHALQAWHVCDTCNPSRVSSLGLCDFCAASHTSAGHRVYQTTESVVSFCDRIGNKSVAAQPNQMQL